MSSCHNAESLFVLACTLRACSGNETADASAVLLVLAPTVWTLIPMSLQV